MTIIKLEDKVVIENKFKPVFYGTVKEIHWHAFGASGLATDGNKERVFDTIVDTISKQTL